MTTNNHTLLATSVAIVAQNADTLEKGVVLSALVLSHLAADAIPHGHYYEFAKLRKTWPGAIFELGFGLFGPTLFAWYLTGINFWWLLSCVFAASAFDFAVASGSRAAKRFNHILHWWDKDFQYPDKSRWTWEIVQTVVLLAIFISIISARAA